MCKRERQYACIPAEPQLAVHTLPCLLHVSGLMTRPEDEMTAILLLFTAFGVHLLGCVSRWWGRFGLFPKPFDTSGQ